MNRRDNLFHGNNSVGCNCATDLLLFDQSSLTLTMYPIVFQFGPLTVYSFGVFMALAALTAAGSLA